MNWRDLLEARVVRWLKSEGDRVKEGEPYVDIETDKVSIQLPAPETGVLKKIRVKVGESFRLGDKLADIDPPP